MIEELKQEFIEKITKLMNNNAELDLLYEQLCLFRKRGMGREIMLECLYTKPSVVMPLYETEKEVLEHFIESICIEEKISEEYLILYNFATDCRYAKEIQAQLLQYLVPFF